MSSSSSLRSFYFKHDQIKDPTLPENLEECGGRGVFIMKELSDEIMYDLIPQGVSKLWQHFYYLSGFLEIW